jgi:hypothetical protein
MACVRGRWSSHPVPPGKGREARRRGADVFVSLPLAGRDGVGVFHDN